MSLTTDRNDPRLKEGQKNETGQHDIHLVLSDEERAKGFVRPVRDTYVHIGKMIERDEEGRIIGRLIPMADKDYDSRNYFTAENGYGGYIKYPAGHDMIGRYITQQEFDAIVARQTHFGGCGTTTNMGRALAETYARDPKFYGATFCIHCNKHLPVNEFVWEATDETVGS